MNTQQTTEEKFKEYAKKWKEQTSFQSSVKSMLTNPNYLRIIALGKDAIPLILNEMKTNPYHWFIALRELTGENPVDKQFAGNIPKMTEIWLEWGKQKGII